MTTLLDPLYRGDTFSYTVTLTDDDGGAYDLAGCALWWTLKRFIREEDAEAVAALSWVSGGASVGITVVSPETGILGVRLEPEETEVIAPRSYVWDLRLKDAASDVWTSDFGHITVTEPVTQETIVA